MSNSKTKQNYVDNERLSADIIVWADEYRRCKTLGIPTPRIPESIGRDIQLIANNLVRLPKFNRYTWIEDMVGDAVENAIHYLYNFNSEAATRSGKPNAFSWLTTSMERVFFDRIETENKQLYLKNKVGIIEIDTLNNDLSELGIEKGESNQMFNDMLERVSSFEEIQKQRKERMRTKQQEKREANKPASASSSKSLSELFLES